MPESRNLKRTRSKQCDFADCFLEMVVPHSEWFALRKYAYELDVSKGAYYDARIGAVNFWCAPDNKPKGWPDNIEQGTLKFPRDYMGAFYADGLKGHKITLHFDVHSYARAERKGYHRGSAALKRLLKGTEADQKWILRQFELLKQHAVLMTSTHK